MRKTIELINELKKERLLKDYAIGGAIGVLKWVEPFFTRDLDIFVVPVVEKEAVQHAQVTEFERIETKVITPEYLVALLLKTWRDKDMREIEMLLKQARIDKKRLDEILTQYHLTGKFSKFQKAHDGR